MNNDSRPNNFYGVTTPQELLAKYDSPLYVYNESVLRTRCREMAQLLPKSGFNFQADYSCKANSNVELLKIIREEGLTADAMSPGEIFVLCAAGFQPSEIFYIGNNVSDTEMRYAIDHQVAVSVDSLSQLQQFGKINPGGKVALRFNPGIGVGHHQKVVTAGKNTKFGITTDHLPEVKQCIEKYHLKVCGLNQHLGSLFLDDQVFLEGVQKLLTLANDFEDLEFIDFGGGMGVPYQKSQGQLRLDLLKLGIHLADILSQWKAVHHRDIQFKIEPGRYVVAECGVLLGRVHAKKEGYGKTYIGTDLGFNVFARAVLYGAEHDIEVYGRQYSPNEKKTEIVTVVGNICESGDILTDGRELPAIGVGDILGIMDAGAYGMSMASNYNNRLRPAEVLIGMDGTPRLIRRRESLEDLVRNFVPQEIQSATVR
ncbi:MAG TPA: diaminopimelate decarboxylase [Firmicutes bacterium]|jgi:diaminopimelate decarboxylase|nr:diaminopimelate decarboxylase [Bacillota bacterium]